MKYFLPIQCTFSLVCTHAANLFNTDPSEQSKPPEELFQINSKDLFRLLVLPCVFPTRSQKLWLKLAAMQRFTGTTTPINHWCIFTAIASKWSRWGTNPVSEWECFLLAIRGGGQYDLGYSQIFNNQLTEVNSVTRIAKTSLFLPKPSSLFHAASSLSLQQKNNLRGPGTSSKVSLGLNKRHLMMHLCWHLCPPSPNAPSK